VAQSGRELTPDIVKAALGPAAAKIPAPQINPVAAPSAQMNSMATPTNQSNVMRPSSAQMGAMGANAFQNLGARGQQAPLNMGMNQQFPPSSNNQLMRPPQGTPPAASLPMQGVGQGPSAGVSVAGPRFLGSNTPNLSTDWFGGRTAAGPTSQLPNRGVAPVNQDGSGLAQLGMAPGVTAKPQIPVISSLAQPKPVDQLLPSSQPVANDSRASVPSGNGFSSHSAFGGDSYSVNSQAKQETSTSSFSSGSFPNSSNFTYGSQNPNKPGQPQPLQSTLALPHGGSQLQSQSLVKQNQLDAVQGSLALATSNVSVGPVTPASSDPQLSWPKITHSNIQKYAKVFVEVDKDRDGKITGPEARNLFLSWRLPRGRHSFGDWFFGF